MKNEYLEGVFFKKAFSLPREEKKEGKLVRRVTVDELIDEISKVLTQSNLLPLMISKLFPADKQWLENVLYTLDQGHSWYKEEGLVTRVVDAE
jgi:hypothetical protein